MDKKTQLQERDDLVLAAGEASAFPRRGQRTGKKFITKNFFRACISIPKADKEIMAAKKASVKDAGFELASRLAVSGLAENKLPALKAFMFGHPSVTIARKKKNEMINVCLEKAPCSDKIIDVRDTRPTERLEEEMAAAAEESQMDEVDELEMDNDLVEEVNNDVAFDAAAVNGIAAPEDAELDELATAAPKRRKRGAALTHAHTCLHANIQLPTRVSRRSKRAADRHPFLWLCAHVPAAAVLLAAFLYADPASAD
jgi:hypothetical protein